MRIHIADADLEALAGRLVSSLIENFNLNLKFNLFTLLYLLNFLNPKHTLLD